MVPDAAPVFQCNLGVHSTTDESRRSHSTVGNTPAIYNPQPTGWRLMRMANALGSLYLWSFSPQSHIVTLRKTDHHFFAKYHAFHWLFTIQCSLLLRQSRLSFRDRNCWELTLSLTKASDAAPRVGDVTANHWLRHWGSTPLTLFSTKSLHHLPSIWWSLYRKKRLLYRKRRRRTRKKLSND